MIQPTFPDLGEFCIALLLKVVGELKIETELLMGAKMMP
jgi:hypothetical protein